MKNKQLRKKGGNQKKTKFFNKRFKKKLKKNIVELGLKPKIEIQIWENYKWGKIQKWWNH